MLENALGVVFGAVVAASLWAASRFSPHIHYNALARAALMGRSGGIGLTVPTSHPEGSTK